MNAKSSLLASYVIMIFATCRARRTRDFDEDFVVKSDTKKRRKRKQPDADTYSEDAYEANLEAEQENLDEESIAHEELENSRPRRVCLLGVQSVIPCPLTAKYHSCSSLLLLHNSPSAVLFPDWALNR